MYSYLPYALIDGFVQLLTQRMSSLMDCAITNLNSLIQKMWTDHRYKLMSSLVALYSYLPHVLLGGYFWAVTNLMSSLVDLYSLFCSLSSVMTLSRAPSFWLHSRSLLRRRAWKSSSSSCFILLTSDWEYFSTCY